MENNIYTVNVHIPGTLAANPTGVVPMSKKIGATLLEVIASASNANDATLQLGTVADPDGYMTLKTIGDSNVPRHFTPANFDGVLADPLRFNCPRLAPSGALSWTLIYDGGDPYKVNEVQVITLTGPPTGGTWTATFGGQTAAGLAYNISAAALQTALRAISSINGAHVTVAGSAGGPYTVTFMGDLAATNVGAITVDGAGLTGGVNEVQVITIAGGADGGTWTATYAGQTAADLAFNISAANLQVAFRALSNIDGANVTVAGSAGGPYTVTFMGTLATTDVAEMTANGAGLTGGTNPTVGVTTTVPGVADPNPDAAAETTVPGATGAVAANVDLMFVFLEGGAHSLVTGLTP